MKKIITLILVVSVMLFAGVLTQFAYGAEHNFGGGGQHFGGGGHHFGDGGHHFGGSFWFGPGWGWGPWWWGYQTYPYYSYYPYNPYYPAYGALQQEPSVYVQPTPKREEQSYWYFCPNPQGYYPYVKRCPQGWMKVVPSTVPPDAEE